MEATYKTKYLIVGPWPRNRRVVRDIIKKHTNLEVSPRKLRPVQLAHSSAQVAIGDANMAFNSSQVSVDRGVNDVTTILKYNIKLLYVSSSSSRESHTLIALHVKEYPHIIEATLPEALFERDAIGAESILSRVLKEHWVNV